MNNNVKYQWLSAINSGEYKIENIPLHNGDKFCFIGVLVDLFIRSEDNNVNATWLNKGQNNRYMYYDDHESVYSTVPDNVLNWSQINNKETLEPIYKMKDEEIYSYIESL